MTLQSNGATATNGVITVPMTCNLNTDCKGVLLLCVVSAFCYPGPTYGNNGGRLAASDFVVPAGTTVNVPIALTDLGNQVATGPGGYEAQVLVDIEDYGYVVSPSSTAGDFALDSNDQPEYPQGATASCGGVVFAGPNTSCPFAENVANAYTSAGDSGTVAVTASSPVTGETYTMQCTGQSPVSCGGGNNALVVFYS
jgi:hypothetical protein